MFLKWYFVRKRIHSSVLIAFLAAGIIGGTILSYDLRFEFYGVSWLILSIILLLICFIFKRIWVVVLIILAGLLIGLWRGDNQLFKLQGYENYTNQTVILSGIIFDDVTEGKHGDVQIELANVRINGKKLPEKVWLSLHTKTKLKRSDFLEVEGKLKPGFGSFGASMNYAKIKSVSKRTDKARDVRDEFSQAVKKSISEPEASLGIGFLAGQRSSLPPEVDEQLRIVGLTHIVVASGYNLTILVRLARRLLIRVSKYLTAAFSVAMISGFILITGFSPSMSRAGLVAVLSLAAWYYGRKINPFVLLPFVAAITLLVNPSFAWGDIGWYLSFAAFGGVMIVAPLLQNYFFGTDKPGFVRQVLGETVAALLATAPIIMLVFEQYSPYALLANVLVVPLIPFIMLAVFIGGVASLMLPLVATIINLPAVGLLQYVTTITQWIASLPGAQTDATIQPIGLTIYYGCLLLFGYYMWLKTKHDFSEDNIIE